MKYSFIIIAYNEEHNLEACIESILNQELLGKSYEIIVIDDGSRDQTPTIVKGLSKKNNQIKLVSDGLNHGRGYGRYTGVKTSHGDYIIMVDADILLPKEWLSICLKNIKKHDVVGGIAVPDGDVAYIYNRFKLKPKTVMGSTSITGNNGFYRRTVFDKVNFDKNLREGEDVDFNHRSLAAGFSSFSIPKLSVEHQEHKSFIRTMHWLYQSGVGATRQLFRFKEIRLPDLAFAATLGATILALVLCLVSGSPLWFIFPLLCVFGASFMHLKGKFWLTFRRPIASLGSLCLNTILIFCYYVGRLVGPLVYVVQVKKQEKTKDLLARDSA
jgi:glycosyltransferase involved in cell wall biosynthesis